MKKSKQLLLLCTITIVTTIMACKNPTIVDTTYQPNTKNPQNYGDSLGKRDHFIRLDSAKIWIRNYLTFRNDRAIFRNPNKDTTLNYPESFNIAALKQLMQIPGCAGFRFYRGMKPGTFVPTLIIFAVDKNGKNLYLKRKIKNTSLNIVIPSIKQTGGVEDPTEEGGLEYSQKDPADGAFITNRNDLDNNIMQSLGGGN